MSDLVEFLRARLDEDEQTATTAAAATFSECPTWTSKDDGTGRQTHGYVMADHTAICGHDDDDVLLPIADHIARHDPARVLREVEAKRHVLHLYDTARHHEANAVNALPVFETTVRALRSIVQALAAVYSDHPDYQQEWTL